MRLLIVNTEKSWRGGERQTLYNIQGFVDEGLEVAILCRKGSPLAERVRELGIEVFEATGFLSALTLLALRGSHFDVIHAQTARSQTFSVVSKLFHRTPVVYTRRVNFSLKGVLTRLKYKNTDHLVAISSSVRSALELFGVTPVTVISDVVLPRKIDSNRAKNFLASHGLTGRKIVATIAALDDDKDPATMIDAVKRLSELHDDFVFLHFGDGQLREEMQKRIDEAGLISKYFLMGFVSDVEDFFSVMDLFCMSSREEGLGSSVLDAFAYRVPVVSTSAGGLKELVSGRGLLCDAGDSQCLARQMDTLLSDPDKSSEFVNRAHDYVMETHSLEFTTRQYIALFQKLVRGIGRSE